MATCATGQSCNVQVSCAMWLPQPMMVVPMAAMMPMNAVPLADQKSQTASTQSGSGSDTDALSVWSDDTQCNLDEACTYVPPPADSMSSTPYFLPQMATYVPVQMVPVTMAPYQMLPQYQDPNYPAATGESWRCHERARFEQSHQLQKQWEREEWQGDLQRKHEEIWRQLMRDSRVPRSREAEVVAEPLVQAPKAPWAHPEDVTSEASANVPMFIPRPRSKKAPKAKKALKVSSLVSQLEGALRNGTAPSPTVEGELHSILRGRSQMPSSA